MFAKGLGENMRHKGNPPYKSIFGVELNQMLSFQTSRIFGREATCNPTGEQQILSRITSNGEGNIISPFILFCKTSFSATFRKEGAREPNKTVLISF